MKCEFEYGRRRLELDIPRGRVKAVLRPQPVDGIADIRAALEASLDEPYRSAPFSDLLTGARSALIVTVDNTRPSPRYVLLPILRRCDKAGVKATICIATGRHRQMTDDEVRRHLGRRIADRYEVVQHDAFDRKRMRHVGTTKRGTEILVNDIVFNHDLVIGVGIIEPSYLAGWSGGRKLLMPGLAYCQSIDENHFWLNDPNTRIGRLHGNPLSDDALEFAKKLPYHFIVHTVVGPNDEATGVVSGDPYHAHERGCRQALDIYRVRKAVGPIVISSPGGYPYDIDLVQGKKAIVPATELVERNGVIILVAECRHGLGAETTFIQWLREKTPAEIVRDVQKRELFSLGAHGAAILARPIVEKNARVVLVTHPRVVRALKGTFVTAVPRLETAWELANIICGKDADVVLVEKARRLICE